MPCKGGFSLTKIWEGIREGKISAKNFIRTLTTDVDKSYSPQDTPYPPDYDGCRDQLEKSSQQADK